jgi:glycosyltransferase involved in cell wall biosynthesis
VTRSLLTVEHSDPSARVLVVTNLWPHAERPEYGIFIKRQVDSLLAGGLRCDVLFVRGYRSPLAYALAAGRLLAANWRRPRYALVHGHSGETALAVRFYLRAPVLVSYCGSDLLGDPRADGTVPLRHRLRRWLLRQHARLLTATLTKSRQMEEALPARLRGQNVVVPNGVDTEAFAPIARDEARSRLGWDPRQPVALFAGDPRVERKRHSLAEAACERAAGELGDLRLHVATGVPPPEMPLLMSAADCLLLTSSIEGSPNVVKEALMCDLPVIATDVGDVRELLAGVEPSWVCEGTPEALAGALVECLPERRRSNGRGAATRLGLGPIAGRILAWYESVAPGTLGAR